MDVSFHLPSRSAATKFRLSWETGSLLRSEEVRSYPSLPRFHIQYHPALQERGQMPHGSCMRSRVCTSVYRCGYICGEGCGGQPYMHSLGAVRITW